MDYMENRVILMFQHGGIGSDRGMNLIYCLLFIDDPFSFRVIASFRITFGG